MKPEEINKAIALLRGWKFKWKSCPNWLSPSGERCVWHPDYYSSLDACAEFERTLTPLHLVEYSYILMELTRTTYEAITATAPQRCEAYLRMKGLWSGEKK